MFSKVLNSAETNSEEDCISPVLRAELIYQGMVFLTEYPSDCEVDGMIEYGTLIARSLEHAKQRAEERGMGETVLGVLKASN